VIAERMTLNTSRGPVDFETRHEDERVATLLSSGASEFGKELAAKYFRFKRWSDSQRVWAHYLVWIQERHGVAPRPEDRMQGLQAIVQLLDRAKGNGLEHPEITFEIQGRTVRLSRCGEKSRAPGAVNVTDGGKYPHNQFFGRIQRDGSCTITDSIVRDFLVDFATDPETKAAEYGHKSGACCFCHRKLDDARSTEVGYGPVCAKRYGMRW